MTKSSSLPSWCIDYILAMVLGPLMIWVGQLPWAGQLRALGPLLQIFGGIAMLAAMLVGAFLSQVQAGAADDGD